MFQVSTVMNQLSFTKGYMPAQWVLNSNPRGHTAVSAHNFNPTYHHDALNEPDFASARTACMEADADARLRRALLRRHRALPTPLAVGQTYFYWRVAGAPRLQKNRWRGPATVVMCEDDAESKPLTYWAFHGT